jgi:hypothetical protein
MLGRDSEKFSSIVCLQIKTFELSGNSKIYSFSALGLSEIIFSPWNNGAPRLVFDAKALLVSDLCVKFIGLTVDEVHRTPFGKCIHS